jgi:hypothetical protein
MIVCECGAEGRWASPPRIDGNEIEADGGGGMSVDAMHGPVREESFLLLTAALSFVDLRRGAISWRELCLWQWLKMEQGGLGSDMRLEYSFRAAGCSLLCTTISH